jgi:hypothetical protein
MTSRSGFAGVALAWLLLPVAACKPERTPGESHAASLARMRALHEAAVSRCDAYRAAMAKAFSTASPLPPPLGWDARQPAWSLDPATKQPRAIVDVAGHRFAFPHDAVQAYDTSFQAYFRLPGVVPATQRYCDPDRNDKLGPIPGQDALVVAVGLAHARSREYLRDATRAWDAAKDAAVEHRPDAGLDLKVVRAGGAWTRLYVATPDRLPDPAGYPRVIRCHILASQQGPEAGRLDCTLDFLYRDRFVARLSFDETRVGEWETMVRATTAALDDAYRGEAPQRGEAPSSP